MKPTISIIIPVYNASRHISNCLDSIVSQTFSNYEVILVNDGSTDNSLEICNDYAKKDSRIRVLNKSNGGVSSARNAGLKDAKGEFVSFVDIDDWISPVFLEKLYDRMKERDDIDFSMCGYNAVKVNEVTPHPVNISEGVLDRNFIVKNIIGNMLNRNSPFNGINSVWNKLYRRSFIGELVFDESRDYAEDWWFNYCLFDKADCISIINEELYYYSITNNMNSLSKKFNDKQIRTLIKTYPSFIEYVKKYNLSEIEANSSRLKRIIEQLIKAKIDLNKREFNQFINKTIRNEEFLRLAKVTNNLNGLNKLLLNKIENTNIVRIILTFLSFKPRMIGILKKQKYKLLEIRNQAKKC